MIYYLESYKIICLIMFKLISQNILKGFILLSKKKLRKQKNQENIMQLLYKG